MNRFTQLISLVLAVTLGALTLGCENEQDRLDAIVAAVPTSTRATTAASLKTDFDAGKARVDRLGVSPPDPREYFRQEKAGRLARFVNLRMEGPFPSCYVLGHERAALQITDPAVDLG